jgi:DNA-binding MarR family transcriptional regulator
MVLEATQIIPLFFSGVTSARLSLGKEIGLKPAESMILALVGANESLSIRELREKLKLRGSNISFTLDCLQKRGLLRRIRGANDKRFFYIVLTDKGAALFQQLSQAENKLVASALSGTTPNERKAVFNMMEKLSFKENGKGVY